MLTEVCDFVHNYFEYAVYDGTFTVEDGTINLDSLVANGQRFRIIGSALNDGIYTYHTDGTIFNDDGKEGVMLASETFTGRVVAMAVPQAVLSIVADIVDWVDKNKTVLDSPYQSESFGGYSYTKASGSGSNAGGALGWQDMFRSRLNAYRKIS
jgi:hypothetical protein